MRLLVPALALLCGAIAGIKSDIQRGSPELDYSRQIASSEHRDTELIEPRPTPLARSTARAGYGLRGKDASKGKQDALSPMGPEGLTWATYGRRRDHWVPVAPQGYLLLRTQNPRAPPPL